MTIPSDPLYCDRVKGPRAILLRGVWALGLAVVALAVPNAAGQDRANARPPYRFYLDGELLDTEEVALGPVEELDLGRQILVGGFLTPLGPGREFRFVRVPNGLQLEQPDGSRRWVGFTVAINKHFDPPDKDPQAALSHDDLAGLWKLAIYDWTPSCSEKVGWINVTRTHLSVSGGSAMRAVPPLPQDLRYLQLDSFEDWGALRNLRELRELSIDHAKEFDASVLSGMTQLRKLTIHARKLVNSRALAKLKRLESVSLSYVGDLESLEFAASLPGLERLEMLETGREARSRLISLRPLSGLRYLKSIHAQGSMVGDLPAGPLPGLRYVDVTRTRVKRSELATLRKAWPDVEFYEGATKSTAKLIAGANRARLYELDDRGKMGGFADVNDATEIAELLGLFQIDDSKGGICGAEPPGSCSCSSTMRSWTSSRSRAGEPRLSEGSPVDGCMRNRRRGWMPGSLRSELVFRRRRNPHATDLAPPPTRGQAVAAGALTKQASGVRRRSRSVAVGSKGEDSARFPL